MSVSVRSVLRLDVLLLTAACLSTCSPLSPHRPADKPLLHARDLLSHFLSSMNLTARRPQLGPLAAHREPPEYMLELYRRFAQDHTAAASAIVVRSFRNEDSSPSSLTARGVRRHRLLFNISALRHEHVTVAELHLSTLVRRAHRPSHGVHCEVAIYRRQEGAVQTREAGKGGRRCEEEVGETEGLEEMMRTQIYATDSSWVSFDLTPVVALWLESGCSTHRLEVHIRRSKEEEGGPAPEVTEGEGDPAEVDINRSLEGKHNAAITVFSEDQSRDQKLDKQELQQMMEHEDDLRSQQGLFRPRRDQRDQQDQLDQQSRLQASFASEKTPPRARRSASGEACRRSPLFVDFKDIGWDTWIIQPLGYEAYECKGACNLPMTSEVSPTKHAIVQSLLSIKSPERTSLACCVPTKLDPISLLYHENGVVTFKHKYEGMVVAECGCR